MATELENATPMELEDIVKYVFSKPPTAPKSNMLFATPETADQFDDDVDAATLEIYVDVAVIGAKILWGENTNVSRLSKEQFLTLQQYMKSFGVRLVILAGEEGLDPWHCEENNIPVKFLRISVKHI